MGAETASRKVWLYVLGGVAACLFVCCGCLGLGGAVFGPGFYADVRTGAISITARDILAKEGISIPNLKLIRVEGNKYQGVGQDTNTGDWYTVDVLSDGKAVNVGWRKQLRLK